MSQEQSVLIIDDEESIRRYLGDFLSADGFEVITVGTAKEGLEQVLSNRFDVVLLDLSLPDMEGLDVLRKLHRTDVEAVVIIITAYGDVNSAVEAMKLGAYDYLTKPFDAEDIELVIRKVLRIVDLEDRIKLLEEQVDRNQLGELITRSRKMYELLNFVDQIAPTPATVLIYGETGTGKELIASRIHKKSLRAHNTFMTVDCASLPENLLESELFGHERGAFTGAISAKKGLLGVAEGGSVFLDEIAELPLSLQSKLLRFLETKQFRRVGGERYYQSDVRIIAATNRDLKRLSEEGLFRSDLFYRLNVVPIHLSPLRERKEDIFPLTQYFVEVFNRKLGKNITTVTNETLQLLIAHDWQGNIRELKNAIEQMVIKTQDSVISKECLPGEIHKLDADRERTLGLQGLSSFEERKELPPFREAKQRVISDFESSYLKRLMEKNNWNISKCAREIGMHRSSFQRLIRKYGLKRESSRK